jgi:hypothetical protein
MPAREKSARAAPKPAVAAEARACRTAVAAEVRAPRARRAALSTRNQGQRANSVSYSRFKRNQFFFCFFGSLASNRHILAVLYNAVTRITIFLK